MSIPTNRRTFYFNTGVRPSSGAALMPGQQWAPAQGGGLVKVIPFDCDDVPATASFKCACDSPNLYAEHVAEGTMLVREVRNSGPYGLLSKYAYFYNPSHLSRNP